MIYARTIGKAVARRDVLARSRLFGRYGQTAPWYRLDDKRLQTGQALPDSGEAVVPTFPKRYHFRRAFCKNLTDRLSLGALFFLRATVRPTAPRMLHDGEQSSLRACNKTCGRYQHVENDSTNGGVA
jgi:hypothetical protein